jgi:hypothetical protein
MGKTHCFYCLSCELMKEMAQSAAVFKTGFYRIEFPLGCCRDCYDRLRQPEERGSREVPTPSRSGA